MNAILRRALPSLCLILFALSARADHCSPRFHGNVFAVRLTTQSAAGQVVYMVFDDDVYSEYLYSPETGETRQLVTAKVSRVRLSSADEDLIVHLPASANAKDVVFRIQDHQLIAGGSFAMPEVLDPEEPVATFAELNGSPRNGSPRNESPQKGLIAHATKFVAHPTGFFCCAACWGVHAALTAEGCGGVAGVPCMDYNTLDPIYCGGGC